MCIETVRFRRASLATLIATMAIGVSLFAQQTTSRALDLFEQALAKERGEGDLGSAITLYERVVAEAGQDRQMAGRALMHMAECYTKLGSPEAGRIYDRVIREFGDQPELVVRARAALTPILKAPAPLPPPGLVSKLPGPGARVTDLPAGRPSPDGRWLVIRSQPSSGSTLSTLRLMNLLTSQVRMIGTTESAQAPCGDAIWSHDSTRVVYPSCRGEGTTDGRTGGLRLADVNGAAPRDLASRPSDFIQPLDWSADGRSILVWVEGTAGTSGLGLVNTANGEIRMLRASGVPRPMASAVALSPDARFAVLTPDTSEKGILVVDIDSGTVRPLVAPPNHDVFLGWHPDGRHLLLMSDRHGTLDVWSAEFMDGALQGAPVPVVADVGPITSLGLTSAGTLYYTGAAQQPTAVTDLFLASTDPSSGRVTAAAQPVPRPGAGHLIYPVWSPDSRRLAYKVGSSPGNTAGVIEILTLATGQERHVTPRIAGTLGQFDWSPDGTQFIAVYTEGDRQVLYRLDAETGAATLVMDGTATPDPSPTPGRGNLSQPRWMPGGRAIAVVMDTRIVVHDLDTGADRTVVRSTVPITSFAVSPDGQSFGFVANRDLMVASVSDGQARSVAELRQGTSARLVAWSQDSRFVVFANRTAAATVPGTTTPYAELWRVPVAGGEPERLNLAADSIIQPAISPDGRWIAFSVNADISPAVHVLDLLRKK